MIVALRQLPRREREAVVLRFYADLPVDATARILVVSVGAVKAYCARGLAHMASVLKVVD